VGRRTDCACSPGIGSAAASAFARDARPASFGAPEQIGAMIHTLDGSIDPASMRPKRTLSAIPRSSG
jgi:hypothetical protein